MMELTESDGTIRLYEVSSGGARSHTAHARPTRTVCRWQIGPGISCCPEAHGWQVAIGHPAEIGDRPGDGLSSISVSASENEAAR